MDFETIVANVADTFWLVASADALERAADDGHDVSERIPGPGKDWADLPYRPVPDSIAGLARRILARIPPEILASGRAAWIQATGRDDERFGHCLAMRIMGTGVGLHDDTPCDYDDLPAVQDLDNVLPTIETPYADYNPESGKVEISL